MSEFSYYHVDIAAPATEGRPAYTAECQDIIDALGMSFSEGCAFKAIWRNAAARTLGKVKPGSQGGLYDAKKVAYYGQRMIVAESSAAPPSFFDQMAAATPRPEDVFVNAVPPGFTLFENDTAAVRPNAPPEKLPLLPIVVGGIYRTRAGDEVLIESEDRDPPYPFNGANGRSYTAGGTEYLLRLNAARTTENDLVERIS